MEVISGRGIFPCCQATSLPSAVVRRRKAAGTALPRAIATARFDLPANDLR